jgi:hypothetical protein
MVRFSLEKIAKGDLFERAGLVYAINPSAFASLAKLQGFTIVDSADVQALVQERLTKRTGLDFQKVFKGLPISRKQIIDASKMGIKID